MEENNKGEEQKPLIFKRQIDEIVKFTDRAIKLENLNINGTDYSLKISNQNGRVCFDFNDKDYEIVIDKKGIRFHRLAYRPYHDHNDGESLQIKVDDSKIGIKKGEILWRARSPYSKDGYDFFYIPFGHVNKC